jgi:hypothetical protein
MKRLKTLLRDRESRKLWLKRIGVAGFLFFLLKGIAWLVIGYFILR